MTGFSPKDPGGSRGPLGGLRVVDFSQAAAGPFCTQNLGDMGAEIVKVEPPQGDMIRGWNDTEWQGLGTYFIGLNRNKRSIVLDLKTDEDREVARALCRKADVVIESYRPGIMQRFGLSYDDLAKDNPSLIYLSISAFGDRGPLRDRAGMDIVLQAFGGIMGITGVEGGEPVKVGAPIADLGTGYAAAMAVAAALVEREHSGLGQHVKLSMLNVVVSLMSNHTTGHLLHGTQVERMGSAHPQLVPYQAFRTKDGLYIIIGILNEGFWRKFCTALERQDLYEDPRFAVNSDRIRNRQDLLSILEPLIAARDSVSWESAFVEHDVPHTRVNRFEDLFSHPQLTEEEVVIRLKHEDLGEIPVIAQPARFSRTPATYRYPPPFLNENRIEVLMETEESGTILGGRQG